MGTVCVVVCSGGSSPAAQQEGPVSPYEGADVLLPSEVTLTTGSLQRQVVHGQHHHLEHKDMPPLTPPRTTTVLVLPRFLSCCYGYLLLWLPAAGGESHPVAMVTCCRVSLILLLWLPVAR